MSKKISSIPLKELSEEFDKGIAIGKIISDLAIKEKDTQYSHRHNYHFFVLQLSGNSHFEIDFNEYSISNAAAIYIAPNQVHRALKADDVECYFIAINSENINEEYIKYLQEIAPAAPLVLNSASTHDMHRAMVLCYSLFANKEQKLYHSMIKNCSNTVIGLIISQYLNPHVTSLTNSQYITKTRQFKVLLEQYFVTHKRPSDYAGKLNISVPYLNECISGTTGHSVSFHIRERIILQAKRLLYNTDKSVKEIALELGFEDYAYFCRLFGKVAGVSPLKFRYKNRD